MSDKRAHPGPERRPMRPSRKRWQDMTGPERAAFDRERHSFAQLTGPLPRGTCDGCGEHATLHYRCWLLMRGVRSYCEHCGRNRDV